MSEFRLPSRYDAVLCLFSSIGYLRTLPRVTRAFRCFREHLAPGGVAVIEPWFAPGVLDPERVFRHGGEANGVRVERVSRVEIEGRVSRLHLDYEITDLTGTRRAQEVHELGLFTKEEMMQAFREAGLDATHDPQGLTGRGLFVARVPAQATLAAGHRPGSESAARPRTTAANGKEVRLRRVTGIGGIFFKAEDPAAMREWYRKHLGIDVQDWGGAAFPWTDEAGNSTPGTTIWNVSAGGDYFAPSTSSFMVNYRVADLHALVAALRAEGCNVLEKIEESEYGKFGWVMDPEGNKVELWEPPPGQ
jgi:predicted enzyme related to lactoylglutathione lyase